MATPTGSLEVQVDIDLTSGKVDASKLLNGFKQKLGEVNKQVKAQTSTTGAIPLDIKFDDKAVDSELKKATTQINKAVNQALKSIGIGKNSKINFADQILAQLKKDTTLLDEQGKLSAERLKVLFAALAKATNNPTGLSARGKNPLKDFLDLAGKSLDEATADLKAKSEKYKQVVAGLKQSQQEALQGVRDTRVETKELARTIKGGQKRTVVEERQTQQSIGGAKSAVNDARIGRDQAFAPGSEASLKQRTEVLNKYINALNRYRIALQSALESDRALGVSEETLRKDLAAAEHAVIGLTKELHVLNGAEKDAVKSTDAAGKARAKAAAEIAKLETAYANLKKVTSAPQSRDPNQLIPNLKEQLAIVQKLQEARLAANLPTKDSYAKQLRADAKALNDQIKQQQQLFEIRKKTSALSKEFKGISTNTTFTDVERLKAIEALIKKITTAASVAQVDTKSFSKLETILEKARADAAALNISIQAAAVASARVRTPPSPLDVASSRASSAQQRVNTTREILNDPQADIGHKERLQLLTRQRNEEHRLLEELRRLATAQQSAGRDSTRTNQAIANTVTSIRGLNRELSGLDNIFTSAAQAFRLFLRYALGYQILYAITGAIGSMVTEVLNLQTALTNIKAVTSATDTQMQAIGNSIQQVAEGTSFSVDEISKAGQILVQAGIPINDFAKTLKAVAELAAATGSSIQEASDVITTFSQVFDDIDPQKLADLLTNAVNISKLTVSDLSTISNFLLAEGKAVGLSAESLLAASSTLRNAGLKASTIGTGLRQGILELFNPDTKTLTALKKRYAEIGINLSKESIKGIFNGFKEAQNPLEAIINELEKLGAGGIGESALTRVFDVRAENVIKSLVANKDELIANGIAIQKAGSASAGAKTQLESLQHSFENLGEAITSVFFDITKGAIGELTNWIHAITEGVTRFRELMTELKATTGDTGSGSAAVAGISISVAAVLSRFSLGWAAVLGVLTAASQQLSRVYDQSESSLRHFASVVKDITVGLALYSVGGAILSRGRAAATAVAGSTLGGVAAGVGSTAVIGATLLGLGPLLGSAGSGIAKVISVLKRVVGFFKFSGWGTLAFVVYEAANYANEYFHWWGDHTDTLKNQADAMQAQADQAKKKAAKLEEAAKENKTAQQQIDAFKASLKIMEEGFEKYTGKGNPEKIKAILQEASKGVVAVGSQQLEDVATAIAEATDVAVKSIDRYDLSSTLQKINTANQQAEALRVQYNTKVNKALSDLKTNPEDTDAQRIVDAYNSLGKETQAFLLHEITNAEEATKLLAALSVAKPVNTEEIKKQQQEATDKVVNAVRADFEVIKGALDTEYNKSKKAAIQLQMREAVDAGQVALVEGILAVTGKLFDKAFLDDAKKNASKKLADKFKKAGKEVDLTTEIAKPALPSVDNFETTAAEKKAQLEEDNLKNAQESERLDKAILEKKKQIHDLTASAVAFAESGSLTNELDAKLSTDLEQKQKELLGLTDKRASLRKEEVSSEETLAAAKRSFYAGELQIAALQERLKQLHSAKLHSVEAESEILRQIYDIQKEQLDVEKDILAKNLAKLIEKEGLFDTKGLSPDQLVKGLSGKAGADALANSKELAESYKALTEVVNQEKNLRDKLLTDLDNVARKELEAKQKSTKSELEKAKSEASSLQSKLTNSNNKLIAARDKLAASYSKLAELEEFFNQALREVSGKKTKIEDARAILESGKQAGDVNLVKKSVSEVQAGLSAGSIKKRDAVSLIEDAREAALEIQNQEIQRNTEQVQYLQEVQSDLIESLNDSVNSQYSLQRSLDALNTQIAALSGQLGASVPEDAAPPTQEAPAQVEVPYTEGLAMGGPVRGAGSGTSDSVPILASNGEFMQPTKAVQFYGADFMEKLRTLKIDPNMVKMISSTQMKPVASRTNSEVSQLQPVLFNVGGDTIHTKAAPDAVAQFQAALRIQALKSGRTIR